MSCSWNRDELMLWLDGELPQGRLEEVENHLAKCSECRRFVEAQKRMEKVWREAWQDPDQKSFHAMREALSRQSAPPWWRKQRNWIAVAAVFAVYLGVKIFIIDPQGSSLSQYATEEMERSDLPSDPEALMQLIEESPEVLVTGDVSVEEQEEQVEEEVEEQMEIIEPLEEDIASPVYQNEPELAAAEEDYQAVSSTVTSVMEEEVNYPDFCFSSDELSEGTDGLVGFTGIEQSEARGSSGEIASDDSPGEHQEAGMTIGGVSSGAGGGGSGGSTECPAVYGGSPAETAEAEAEADFDDSLHRYVMADVAAQECVTSTDDLSATPDLESSEFYTVTASLSTGDCLTITRDNWGDLFQLIDSLAEKLGCADQVITMSVDSLGTVTGECISDVETRVSVPREDLRDCSITVYFH